MPFFDPARKSPVARFGFQGPRAVERTGVTCWRKASAAGALEAERAEKVRREVQWAHVRAAMCGVLRRAGRKKAGRRRASVTRISHAPGTATIVHIAVPPSQVQAVTEKEGIKETRPKRKCKEVPPGTYAPMKRAKGTPPGRPPDPPPPKPFPTLTPHP